MPAKKKTGSKGLAASEGAGVQVLHGVPLSMGDFKKAAKGKTGVRSDLPRKAIEIVKGFNPRAVVADVEDLANSIKKDGLINPVTVRPKEGKSGVFQLVAGERRLRAMDLLKQDTIPCNIRPDLEGDDLKAKAIAVAENSEDKRYSLNYIEIGRVVSELTDAGWAVNRIAQETGVHPQKVRRCQTLMEAPTDVQSKVETGELSMIAGLELARADSGVRKKIQDSLHPNISAADMKKLVKAAAKSSGAEDANGKTAKHLKGKQRDAALVTWQPSKAKQAKLREVCYMIVNSTAEEKEYAEFFETRAVAATLLWDRGDFPVPHPPTINPDSAADGIDDAKEAASEVKAAKAALKKYNDLVASEAAKFVPPDTKHKGKKPKT